MENRITDPGVLGDSTIKIVHFFGSFLEHYVLQQGSRPNRSINIGLFLLCKVDYLCVATSFKIKNGVFLGPTMLIIPDKFSVRVGRQGCFTCSGQPKENCSIPILAHIGGT